MNFYNIIQQLEYFSTTYVFPQAPTLQIFFNDQLVLILDKYQQNSKTSFCLQICPFERQNHKSVEIPTSSLCLQLNLSFGELISFIERWHNFLHRLYILQAFSNINSTMFISFSTTVCTSPATVIQKFTLYCVSVAFPFLF